MAGRDYLMCSFCGVKIFYDGDQRIRDHLEFMWGDKDAQDWTVNMLCPSCIKEQRELLEEVFDKWLEDADPRNHRDLVSRVQDKLR